MILLQKMLWKKGFYLSLSLALAACANVVAPTGGPKDTTPPQVVKTLPKNKSVTFNKQTIEIQFDEFFTVKNPNQIIISPLLKYPITHQVKHKTLILKIKDTLHKETTYNISLNNVVADITENNLTTNLNLIFSTGNTIDSCKITGQIKDAETLLPAKDVLVMLYKNNEDSVFLKQKPFYYTKTDANGMYKIQNLKPNKYKIVALKDANNNLIYDQPTEAIAFQQEQINGCDSLPINMFLFTEALKKQQLIKVDNNQQDKIKLIFTKPLKNKNIKWLDPNISDDCFIEQLNSKKDTLTLWVADKQILGDSIRFVIFDNQQIIDTVRTFLIKPKKRNTKTNIEKNATISLTAVNPKKLNDHWLFNTLEPLSLINPNNILLTTEAKDNLKFKLKQNSPFSFSIMPIKLWEEGKNYTITFLPDALENYKNLPNKDTIKISFKAPTTEETGTLNLLLNFQKQTSSNLIIYLINEKNQILTQQQHAKANDKIVYEYLTPGSYKIKAVIDSNNNQEWDTGDYLTCQQPETILFYDKPINIRANWDLNIEWILP